MKINRVKNIKRRYPVARVLTAGAMALLSGLFLCFAEPADNDNQKDNQFKIYNELVPMYYRAVANAHYLSGKLAADSMYNRAVELGDDRGMCIALTVLFDYYDNIHDHKSIEVLYEKMKRESDKPHLIQNYYFACFRYITYLLSNNHKFLALQHLAEVTERAKAQNSKQGQFSSMRAMGEIMYASGEYDKALQHFTESLDYAMTNMKNRNPAPLYYQMSQCCNFLEKYQQAYENAMKGATASFSDLSRTRCQLEACYALFYLNKKDEFLKLYEEISKKFDVVKDSYFDRVCWIKSMYYILNKDFDNALAMTDKPVESAEKHRLKYFVYYVKGDYEPSYREYRRYRTMRDSARTVATIQDLKDQEIYGGNQALQEAAQKMELANVNLEISNSNQALREAKSQAEAERLKSENAEMDIKNQQLEAKNIQAEIDAQRVEQDLKRTEVQNAKKVQTYTSVSVGLILLALVVGLLFMYRWTKKIRTMNKDLKQRNTEIDEQRDKAIRASKIKSMFVQNMSHEIRTPINAITGFSRILAECSDDITPEEKADFSERIKDSSDLVLNILTDILDISSIESGNYKVDIKETAINSMSQMAAYNVAERIPHHIEFKKTTDFEDTDMVSTDPKRVVQVIINFLTNAIKNTKEGSIHLHCSKTENLGYVSFVVTDTGCGVPEEKMDLIFERFRKLDDLKPGAGLGLNICTLISERLNGKLYIDKTYRTGARFVFAVPLDEKDQNGGGKSSGRTGLRASALRP